MQKVIRLEEVMKMTSMSRTSIYTYIKQAAFPKPIKLGARSIGFILDEIEAWIERQKRSRLQIVA